MRAPAEFVRRGDQAPEADATGVERLIGMLARLPGLGPRSARRAALYLLRHRDDLLAPLSRAMATAADEVKSCSQCGNYSMHDICGICADPNRNRQTICVVESVADLWAMERAGIFRGRYHVLGGVLTAVGNVRPEDLRIPELSRRVRAEASEVILALNATFDGQTTAHYVIECLDGCGAKITRIGYGVPVGGELDYLDGDTIAAAFRARLDV